MREHTVTQIRALLEGDAEIRNAERSGDVEEIIKAYKRAGQEGGGASAFGRAHIADLNRKASKIVRRTQAITFIDPVIEKGHAVVMSGYAAVRTAHETPITLGDFIPIVLIVTRGSRAYPARKMVWDNYITSPGGFLYRTQGVTRSIEELYHIYEQFREVEGMEPPKLAVIPHRALPRQIRKHFVYEG